MNKTATAIDTVLAKHFPEWEPDQRNLIANECADSADAGGFEAGFYALYEPLKWMQGHKGLNAYLGKGFGDIANDLIDRAYPSLREGGTMAVREEEAEPDIFGWIPLAANTSWIDGRDIELLVHGMVVEGRYCPGEWSSGNPIDGGPEYSGAAFSCMDDALSYEIEEIGEEPKGWSFHPATHWREKTPRPEVNS